MVKGCLIQAALFIFLVSGCRAESHFIATMDI